jgi:hypothetical protein
MHEPDAQARVGLAGNPMTWRKWLVRGLVFSVVAAGILLAVLYEAWTNPTATRRQVLDKLGEKFLGATVTLESARLRLLGGIALGELRMARRDDLDKEDFLYVPSAVLYHDKEQLLQGKLTLRKIELYRPRLRVVRERDGRLNLKGLLGPVSLDEHVPTIAIHQAAILVEDRDAAPGSPLLEIHDVEMTLRNDPLPTLTLEGSGQSDVAGPVRFSARVQREDDAASVHLELPEVPLGPALIQRLSRPWPEAAVHLRQLKATAQVGAVLAYQPGASQPWAYDVNCELKDGSFSHARLPLPLEEATASLHLVNGLIPAVHLKGRLGPAHVELALKDAVVPDQVPASLCDLAREAEVRLDHLPLTPELLAQLPACREIQENYSPRGPVSLVHTAMHSADGRWHRHWTIHPEGIRGAFCHFRYPLEGVTGVVESDNDSEHGPRINVDLTARAAGRPVTIKGEARGPAPSAGVDFTIEGKNIPLDDTLFRALPPKSQELARTFLSEASRANGLHVSPMGLGDIQAFVRRERGGAKFSNRYVVAFHDAAVKADVFPLSVEGLSGVLDILPDHWECRDFRGAHKGGEIRFEGRSFRLPSERAATAGSAEGRVERPDRIKLLIRGRDVLLDRDFEQALAPPDSPGRADLLHTWKTLGLKGRMTFTAEVIDQPDQPQDIDVAVHVRGCTLQPAFFSYSLSDMSGSARYLGPGLTRDHRPWVFVGPVTARHGPATLSLKGGLLVVKPAGGFLAWFQGIRGQGLVPDRDLLAALPPGMGKGLEPLHLSGPLDVQTTLTLDAPRDGERLKVWWDGDAVLRNATLTAGVALTEVDGQFACHGYHNGQAIEGLAGDLVLDRATVLGQPFRNIHARVQVLPDAPDVLRVADLKADLFGGTLGGQAHIEFGTKLRYQVLLEALQVRLEEFARHNLGAAADVQGPVRAGLYLTGEGADLSGLRGKGQLSVDNGKIYRLPLLLDLLKAFSLRAPDGTAFDQARVAFTIDGPQARVGQLDLIGNAISLRGHGTLNLNGTDVNLDFNTDWGRLQQILPTPVSDLSQAFSNQMLRIKMRGQIGDVRFEKVLLPGVIDPLKKAMGRTP